MPELPEVEHARRLCAAHAVGRTITTVKAARDSIVIPGGTRQLTRALGGRAVVAAHRRGKYLWLQLSTAPHLLLHLGMTGAVRIPHTASLQLASSPRGGEPAGWPPPFTKLRLVLDDGGEVAFTNKRRLGRVRLLDDPENEPPISRLGFDPLLDLPPPAAFRDRVAGRRVTLKGLLLDQSFSAGVGNWIADEVLYQAGLDPRRRGCDLTAQECERLRRKLRHVIKKAVAVDARKDRFPRTWLFHRRWGKRGDATTHDGHKVEHIEVAGRTTAYVPAVQG